MMRDLLARVLTDPALFRLAVMAGKFAWPLGPLLRVAGLKRIAAMLRMTPRGWPGPPADRSAKVYSPEGPASWAGGAAGGLHQSGAGAVDQ